MFTFGHDCEFMIADRVTGIMKSAIGIVHGTKEDKIAMGNDSYAFYDNVLVEVNVKPANTKQDAIQNSQLCFQSLTKLIGKKNKIVVQAAHAFTEKDCQHPDAFVFGCEPAFDIYKLTPDGYPAMVEPIEINYNNYFRTAGGHIHIGHDCCNLEKGGFPPKTIFLCDVFIGIPALLIDHDSTSHERLKLYGGAGIHRVTKYGVEYRTLSNFWFISPKYFGLIYDLVEFIIEQNDLSIEIDKNLVKNIINTSNIDQAKLLYNQVIKKYLPNNIIDQINNLQIKKTYNFEKEWNINPN